MVYLSYIKLWEGEFDGSVSRGDKIQDVNFNQLILEVHDIFEKVEKTTTNFQPTQNTDVINKAHMDENYSKIQVRMSHFEKDYNEYKLEYNKQSSEVVLIQRAVKTIIQILYYKGWFDNYAVADKVLEDFLITARRRRDLEKVNDVIQ